MLLDANSEKAYWAEAVNMAVYIINRSPTGSLNEKTPEEAWTGKKADLSEMIADNLTKAELRLEFDEQKEQVAVELFSKEMPSMITTKSHLDVDDLYNDLVTYERIIAERRQRQTRQNTMRTHNTTTAHPQKISHDAPPKPKAKKREGIMLYMRRSFTQVQELSTT
ncbi:hypothetical protein Trydic_g8497 [Trypoxylus dichotomus]